MLPTLYTSQLSLAVLVRWPIRALQTCTAPTRYSQYKILHVHDVWRDYDSRGQWTIGEAKLKCVLKLVSIPCWYFIPIKCTQFGHFFFAAICKTFIKIRWFRWKKNDRKSRIWWKRRAFGDKPMQKRGSIIDRRMTYTDVYQPMGVPPISFSFIGNLRFSLQRTKIMIGLLYTVIFIFYLQHMNMVVLNQFDRFLSGEGSHIDMVYVCMCLTFGALFREIWYSGRGFFIRDEGAQIA